MRTKCLEDSTQIVFLSTLKEDKYCPLIRETKNCTKIHNAKNHTTYHRHICDSKISVNQTLMSMFGTSYCIISNASTRLFMPSWIKLIVLPVPIFSTYVFSNQKNFFRISLQKYFANSYLLTGRHHFLIAYLTTK